MIWTCILQLKIMFLTTKNKILDNENKSNDNNSLYRKQLELIS